MDFANYWFSSGSNRPPGPDPGFIGNSLRFRGAQQLSRTFGSGGNRQRMTISFWHKNSNNTSQRSGFMAVGGQSSGNVAWGLYGQAQSPQANGQFYLDRNAINGYGTTGNYRDPSAWYHVVLRIDTTQSSATNRFRMYINGAQDSGSSLNYSINDTFAWNGNFLHRIGQYYTNTSEYLRGYLAEYHFVDGQSLAPTAFAEANADGVWAPITYANGWGTTGFYLDFSDPADIGADRSGNGNNWTPTGFELTNTSSINYDWMADSPTNNYPTYNPLLNGIPHNSSLVNAMVDANLTLSGSSSASSTPMSTMAIPTTGQWYCECRLNTALNNADFYPGIFRVDPMPQGAYNLDSRTAVIYYYAGNGSVRVYNTWTAPNSPAAQTVTFNAGDTIGMSVDMDNNLIRWFHNGTAYAGITDAIDTTKQHVFSWGKEVNSQSISPNWGNRPTQSTPPAGYEWLHSANLPDVAITNPSDHFRIILDTGANILTNAQAQVPNGLWWIKDRANSNNHQLLDSVRGGTTAIRSPIASTGAYSAPAGNSVAWCWNLVPDRSNGFDIVTYQGDSVKGRTVPHNLSQAPEFMIVTSYSVGDNKAVYHTGIGPTQALLLNADSNQITSDRYWNDTAPTNSEFTVGDFGEVNGSGRDCIAYLWHSIPGYSAFGSYQGNNNADGPFIYTGFRPAWVMVKLSNSSGQSWIILDSQRNTYNPAHNALRANLGDIEITNNLPDIDFCSNGFKVRSSWADVNATNSFIYAAFAEHPFGGGNVSPSPAR